jgi:hypothetical protein
MTCKLCGSVWVTVVYSETVSPDKEAQHMYGLGYGYDHGWCRPECWTVMMSSWHWFLLWRILLGRGNVCAPTRLW